MAFGPHKVPIVQCIRRFPISREIRRRVFEFEDAFKAEFPSPAQVPNVADDTPADAPRFVLQAGKKQLIVTASAVLLQMDFSEGLPGKGMISDVLNKYAVLMDKALDALLPSAPSFSGIAVVVAKPYSGTGYDLMRIVQNRLLADKVRWSKPAASNISTGFLSDAGFYRVFDFSFYKTFNFSVANGERIEIDQDFTEAHDEGLQVKVDVNNRNEMRSQRDFTRLLPELKQALSIDLPEIFPEFGELEGVNK